MPELNFKGKEFVYNHHLTVPFRPLLPQADKSIGAPALDGNLIIHGDNLHGLKALLPTHAGKVDCIFIDPPYNTGKKDWSYNDNVNSPMIKEWLKANPINIDDKLRHDKWCAMMWPRLRLLHELLSDTGSIWMTLDHNEGARGRLLLDEIFGEDNFLAHMAWEKVYSPRMDADKFSNDVDQVIVYAKNKPEVYLIPVVGEQNEKQFTYIEPDTGRKARLRTLRKEGSASLRSDRENGWYPILAPDGTKIFPVRPDGREGRWRWEEKTYLEEIKKAIPSVMIQKNEEGQWEVWVKQYFKGEAERPISTLLRHTEYGHTHGASEEIKQYFGDAVFETPKPERLLTGIINLASPIDGLILDSFAGSGTTAAAVLQSNAKYSECRKFILVEGEDYADNLTAERVRRVINGYNFTGTQRDELLREPLTFSKLKQANSLLEKVQRIETLDGPKYDNIAKTVKDGALIVTGERAVKGRTEGLGGSFTYCELGAPIDMDGLLTGADLPDAAAMAALLYHTATAQAFDPASLLSMPAIGEGVMQLGVANGRTLWLIYKPDLDWLKSSEAALTLSRARAIAAHNSGEHLVFAPAKFVSRELLAAEKLPVEFAPLPFALYRVETA